MQQMWAGLLATACTSDGNDQRNLVFVNLLEQMTSSQAKLLRHACETAHNRKTPQGYIQAGDVIVSNQDAMVLLGTSDIHDADVQLDHLRELGVLSMEGGFHPHSDRAYITPSALGLHLYVRSNGYNGSPIDYFEIVDTEEESAGHPGTSAETPEG